VPRDAKRLTLPVRIAGATVAVSLIVQAPTGRLLTLPLTPAAPPGRYVFNALVPAAARGGRVVSLRVTLTGTGAGQRDPQAVVIVSALRAGRRIVSRFGSGWRRRGRLRPVLRTGRDPHPDSDVRQPAAVRDRPRSTRPRRAGARRDQRLARSRRARGTLAIELPGGQVVRFKPVAVAHRFPTVPRDAAFVVADTGRLFAAMNMDTPGSAIPTEMWLALDGSADAAAVAARLRRPPFRTDALVTRAGARSSLDDDPLMTVTVTALELTGAIALLMAVAALLLSVAATLRDEDGELAELEALGVDPRLLRRQIRAGAASSAVVAAVTATLASIVLLHVFIALTGLGGDGRDPLPPLVARLPLHAGGVLLGLAAAAGAAGVALVTAHAMRGERVGRLCG
jgi:hypothetical protein